MGRFERRWFVGLALSVTVAVSSLGMSAHAQDGRDYKALNIALTRNHIVPRLERFADETKTLTTEASSFCAAPSAGTLENLRAAYHGAMDAWMGIQHIGFGPSELLMRQYRVEFWPDPRNITSRHLRELLAEAAQSAPDPEKFAKGSVAVQGFPALERLLFGNEAAGRLTVGDAAAKTRCDVIRLIAGNLAEIAGALFNDWSAGPDAYAKRLADPQSSDGRFADDREVTLELFKSLHAGVQSILNRKLRAPLGDSIDRARPRLAESWRSGRSLRNIALNLEALKALYDGDGGLGFDSVLPSDPGGTELNGEVRGLFDRSLAAVRKISMPLDGAVTDASERRNVEALAAVADRLHLAVEKELGAAMGLPMGFNSLDGD
jgi:predicted lipoprotein